jgi:hypothetical protein
MEPNNTGAAHRQGNKLEVGTLRDARFEIQLVVLSNQQPGELACLIENGKVVYVKAGLCCGTLYSEKRG